MTTAAPAQEQARTVEEIANGQSSNAIQKQATRALKLQVQDDSSFSSILDTARYAQVWEVANCFAASTLVPKHFQGQAPNCFIAMQMAIRMNIDPFMFMQNTYIVHGKPGMEAKLAIALMNKSGLFVNGIEYEIEGDDPKAETYRVRAFATRAANNKTLKGPWVDWAMVKAEGWFGKEGSKWKTIPGLMFMYRAATFFGRLYCPECLMGMYTSDELEDSGPSRIEQLPEGRTSFRVDQSAGALPAAPVTGEVIDRGTGEVVSSAQTAPATDAQDAAAKIAQVAEQRKTAEAAGAGAKQPSSAKPVQDPTNPVALAKVESLIADCVKKTDCDRVQARGALVNWLGTLGYELHELDNNKVVREVNKALPDLDWAQYV